MTDFRPFDFTAYQHGEIERGWKPEWIIEGIWRKDALNIYAGPPKVGRKSSMRRYLMACAITGEPVFGFLPTKKVERVLSIIGEDDYRIEADCIDTAIRSLGHDPNDFADSITHLVATGLSFSNRTHAKYLAEMAKPFDLVTIDPLALFHEADENSAQEMSVVMRHIRYIIHHAKVGIGLTHHTGKQPPDGNNQRDDNEMLRGSSVIAASHDNLVRAQAPSTNARDQVVLTFQNKVPPPCGQLGALHMEIDNDTWVWSAFQQMSEEDVLKHVKAHPGIGKKEMGFATRRRLQEATKMIDKMIADGRLSYGGRSDKKDGSGGLRLNTASRAARGAVV